MATVLKISDAASLAMHTMVLLAAEPEQIRSTREIADELKVSEAHLSKVLQRLARAGLVRSVRGPRGGFKLERAQEEAALLGVYEAIEGRLESSSCLLEVQSCQGELCILGALLDNVNREVRDYLAGTKLSQLTGVFRRKGNVEPTDHSN
jgi:Rrf2 family protein